MMKIRLVFCKFSECVSYLFSLDVHGFGVPLVSDDEVWPKVEACCSATTASSKDATRMVEDIYVLQSMYYGWQNYSQQLIA